MITPTKLSSDPGSAASRLLSERLRELDINSSGLPPHVLAHLRGVVDTEMASIQRELTAEVAALQHKADAKIRKQVTRAITLRTVGKAFQKMPAAHSGETPNLPQTQALKRAGGTA